MNLSIIKLMIISLTLIPFVAFSSESVNEVMLNNEMYKEIYAWMESTLLKTIAGIIFISAIFIMFASESLTRGIPLLLGGFAIVIAPSVIKPLIDNGKGVAEEIILNTDEMLVSNELIIQTKERGIKNNDSNANCSFEKDSKFISIKSGEIYKVISVSGKWLKALNENGETVNVKTSDANCNS